MSSKIKTILILVAAAVVLVLIYILFIKKGPADVALISSTGTTGEVSMTNTPIDNATLEVSQDFITTLLSVKSIKLDDTIFKEPSFISLRDSSIILVQDGNEGRPNPFAPIGSETAPTIPTTPTPTTPPVAPTP